MTRLEEIKKRYDFSNENGDFFSDFIQGYIWGSAITLFIALSLIIMLL